MAWQWEQYHASIAEHVTLTVDHINWCFLLPFSPDIALRLRAGRAGSFHFLAMNDEGRALEEAIAAAMIRMQVRAHDEINVVTAKSEAGQRFHDILVGRHDRRHQPR